MKLLRALWLLRKVTWNSSQAIHDANKIVKGADLWESISQRVRIDLLSANQS